MSRRLGINIETTLHSPGGDIPHETFARVLKAVNDASYASELDDLEALAAEFSDLPRVAFDAAAYRMRRYRKSAITITSARTGSIIIATAVGALGVFVLQQTLGETLKEAWLQSDGHKKLKSFLLQRRGVKAQQLAEDVQRRVRRVARRDVGLGYDLPAGDRLNEPANIRIRVTLEVSTKLPPRLESVFPDEPGPESFVNPRDVDFPKNE